MNIRQQKVSMRGKFLLSVKSNPAIERSLSNGASVAVSPNNPRLKQEVW